MRSLLTHAKIQAPLATMRSRVSDIWRAGFAFTGRYSPMGAAELKTVSGGTVEFSGDVPLGAAGQHAQSRLFFERQRPYVEEVENLIVTPNGHGWKDEVLVEKYSSAKPGLRALRAAPNPEKTIPYAYLVQSEHTDTFGDWISEYLSPLSNCKKVDGPVLLPQGLARRDYVKRDAGRLGIDFRPIEQAVRIGHAKVVRQQRVVRYWTGEQADQLRQFMSIAPAAPKPGSVLYLSRHGETSQVADRSHPNLLVESLVRENGGVVLRTADATLEQYMEAAPETVIFDHGSAAYNMVYWRPRRVIELVSDAWWMNAFLFFADSIGVKDYTIIRSDLGGADRVCAMLKEALSKPNTTGA